VGKSWVAKKEPEREPTHLGDRIGDLRRSLMLNRQIAGGKVKTFRKDDDRTAMDTTVAGNEKRE